MICDVVFYLLCIMYHIKFISSDEYARTIFNNKTHMSCFSIKKVEINNTMLKWYKCLV